MTQYIDNLITEGNLRANSWAPGFALTPNTLNGTLTLTAASAYQQEITGANTGYKVKLPNAQTLAVGWKYEFYNSSMTSFSVLYDDSTVYFYIPPSSMVSLVLESIPNTNGLWLRSGATLGVASGLLNYTVSSSTPFSYGTGTTALLITGMSLTPASGSYFVTYQGSIVITGNNTSVTTAFFKDGSQVTDSIRTIASSVSTFNTTHISSAIVPFTGSEILEVKIAKSSNSNNATINSRNLVLLRLGD